MTILLFVYFACCLIIITRINEIIIINIIYNYKWCSLILFHNMIYNYGNILNHLTRPRIKKHLRLLIINHFHYFIFIILIIPLSNKILSYSLKLQLPIPFDGLFLLH